MNPHALPLRRLALPLLTVLALALGACSRPGPETDPTQPANSAVQAQAYDLVASQARGFTVGPQVSAQVVYVLFDPQCPHCAHLWQAAQPLLDRVRFVWVPVAILNQRSAPQGVTLLQATDPAKAMTGHEQALLSGRGGIAVGAALPADLLEAVKTNTGLLDRLGADAVPFIVARHAGSGQPVIHSGALDTAALQTLLGLP
jgi:thiol:disulfide interchange protein DsbG